MTMQTVPQSLANLKTSQRLGGIPAPGPPSAQRGPATQISSYITSAIHCSQVSSWWRLLSSHIQSLLLTMAY